METRTIRNVVIKGEEIEDLKMAGASAKVFRVWCGFKAAENKDGGASVTEIATLLGISVRRYGNRWTGLKPKDLSPHLTVIPVTIAMRKTDLTKSHELRRPMPTSGRSQ